MQAIFTFFMNLFMQYNKVLKVKSLISYKRYDKSNFLFSFIAFLF